jgi:hypothetical protein
LTNNIVDIHCICNLKFLVKRNMNSSNVAIYLVMHSN